MSSVNVKEATDQSFESEVLQAGTPVLVDFWAPWCGPCRSLAPTLDAIADENVGKVKVVKVNVDDNPNTAARFGIRGIPAVMCFNKGTLVNQVVGAVPKAKLEELFTALV